MGFVYNGISSQSMKIRARLTSWSVFPPLRNAYITVPGRPGVSDFGSDSDSRIITVRCGISPQRNFSDMVSILDYVAEWLNPENGLCQLVLDDVPDRYFMARLTETVDCSRLLRAAGSFDLKFICPDTYAYALADEIYTISSIGNHEVRRLKGNVMSEPVYSIRGIVSQGVSTYISVKTNGSELRVIGALNSGETLVVDANKVTAKVVDLTGETVRNGLPCLQELNFPVLQNGNNTVVVSASGVTFSELKIEAKSRWR